jgi:hypothetical protein
MDVAASNADSGVDENIHLKTSVNTGLLPTINTKQENNTQTDEIIPELQLPHHNALPSKKPELPSPMHKYSWEDDDSESDEEIKLPKRLKKKQKLKSRTIHSKKSVGDDGSIGNASDHDSDDDSTLKLPKRTFKKRRVLNMKRKVNLQRLVKQEIAKLKNTDNFPKANMKPYTSSLKSRPFSKNVHNSTFYPSIYGKAGPSYSHQSALPMLLNRI